MASMVVVDDDSIRTLFQTILTNHGHRVLMAKTAAALYEAVASNNLDIALVDMRLPDGSADQVVAEVVKRDPLIQVIVISSEPSTDTTIRVLSSGAFRCLTKPFNAETLTHVVSQALEARRAAVARLTAQRTALRNPIPASRLVGSSPAICAVNLLVDRVAKTPSTPVLITGESGTGKEAAAHAIHHLSARREKPFVKISCAAIPRPLIEAELFGEERGTFTSAPETRRGLFELADGGTIFLDEVGALDPPLQARLLHVLEHRQVIRAGSDSPRQVDVRVIAATNRNLQQMCSSGSFREDLYFRLAVTQIQMPPLRERPQDIEPLAHLFLREKSLELGKQVDGFSPQLTDFFHHYHWPGNVRELRNLVERLVILADSEMIQLDEEVLRRFCFDRRSTHLATSSNFTHHSIAGSPRAAASARAYTPLPPPGPSSSDLLTLDQMEREHLMRALTLLNFNKTHCAQKLGISRSTLQRKISAFGLEEWVESNKPQTGF